MTQLQKIKQHLEQSKNVVILPYQDDNADELREYFTEYSTMLTEPGQGHKIKLYVAPSKGLYTARELQEFMKTLIPPNMKPDLTNRFRQDIHHSNENFLGLGSIRFKEIYGTEDAVIKRDCKLNDDIFANDFGFKDKKKTVESKVSINYNRFTSILVYPNEEIGNNALKEFHKKGDEGGKLQKKLYVSLDEIEKYEPNIINILKERGEERFT